MQRFKLYAMKKGNVDAHNQPRVFGRRYGFGFVPEATQCGKFSYNSTVYKHSGNNRSAQIAAHLSLAAYFRRAENKNWAKSSLSLARKWRSI
jgi:hypothetical protein